MSKKIKPKNNVANMQNPNKGTQGQNQQVAQNQGNRGKQLGGQTNRPIRKKP